MNAKTKKSAAKTMMEIKKRPYHVKSCNKVNMRYKEVAGLPRSTHIPRRAGRRV